MHQLLGGSFVQSLFILILLDLTVGKYLSWSDEWTVTWTSAISSLSSTIGNTETKTTEVVHFVVHSFFLPTRTWVTFWEMLNVFRGAAVISVTRASGQINYGSFPCDCSVISLIVLCKTHAILKWRALYGVPLMD